LNYFYIAFLAVRTAADIQFVRVKYWVS